MVYVLTIIWNIALDLTTIGFFPSCFLIYQLWKDRSLTSKLLERWVPLVVFPWLFITGVNLFLFIILLSLIR